MGACHSTKSPDPRQGNHHYRTQHLAKQLSRQQQKQQQQQQAISDPPPHTSMSPIKDSHTHDKENESIQTSRPQSKHMRASSAPIRPPSDSVFITNIQSHIGRATVRALTSTNPLVKIRGGVSMIPSSPYVDGHRVDMVRCDIRKRQSMIWDLIGVQTLLITPCATDAQYLAALFIVAAAKVAGVKFVAVVSMPDIHGHPKTGAASPTSMGTTTTSTSSTQTPQAPIPQQPNVIEQAVLKAKLDCCFIRLPFFIDDEHISTEEILRQEPHPHKLSFSALTDIGTACASILSEYPEHINAQYDMSPSAYHDAYVNNSGHPSTATTACASTAHSAVQSAAQSTVPSAEHSRIGHDHHNGSSTHISALQLAGLTTSVAPQPKSRSPSISRSPSVASRSISSSPSMSSPSSQFSDASPKPITTTKQQQPTKKTTLPGIRMNETYAHNHPVRHAHTARRMETAH